MRKPRHGRLLQQVEAVAGRVRAELIALLHGIGIKPREPEHEVCRQRLAVEHLSLDRTGNGQQLADLLTVKARPEDPRRVQQLQSLIDRDPLLAARDAPAGHRRRLPCAAPPY